MPDLRSLELAGEMLRGTRHSYRMDKRYLRKDRSVVWVQLDVSLIRAPDGSPAYFTSHNQDITWCKQAEAALSHAVATVERERRQSADTSTWSVH